MLSNAYFIAKFRFDTAENEPAQNLQIFEKCIFRKCIFRKFCKFWRARSRLYQNEILQENMRSTAFFKLYKICILLHRCNLKIFAKNRFEKSAIFVKIQQHLNIFQNVANFANFANLVDFEKCCKTHIYTPPLGGQKTQAFWLAPQKNLLALMLVRHFQRRCGVPRCDDMR